MEHDRFTVLLLQRRTDRPPLSPTEADAIQDTHLARLERLHADGRLVAVGPVRGSDPSTPAGLGSFGTGFDEARALSADDPAVGAGLFRVEVFSWSVPKGAMEFDPVRFPRSRTDADVT